MSKVYTTSPEFYSRLIREVHQSVTMPSLMCSGYVLLLLCAANTLALAQMSEYDKVENLPGEVCTSIEIGNLNMNQGNIMYVICSKV